VELGISLPGVKTALNVEKGIELLRGAIQSQKRGDGDHRQL